jgi:hypothetical protein
MSPQWYFTNPELEKYLTMVVRKRWDTAEVGAKLEAFAIAGSDITSTWSMHHRHNIKLFESFTQDVEGES